MNRGYRGRRTFLFSSLKAAAGLALPWPAVARRAEGAWPAFVRQDTSRPGIRFGVASGDVTRDRAIIWSRTDRPARMLVEWSTTESFQNVRRVRGPVTGPPAGYTARVDVPELPPDQRIFYRVQF